MLLLSLVPSVQTKEGLTMREHGSPPRGERRLTHSPIHEGRFGRMFRRLAAAPERNDPELEEMANAMRESDDAQPPGGWSAGGGQTDGDNELVPAAYTYLGQFLDHDITFDPVSALGHLNDPDALVDFRSPRFDLDSVYGSGPADEPFQYEPDGVRLLVENNSNGEQDLPRNSRGTALIGDPRNDENTVVSQLQLVFIRLHNRFVQEVENEGVTGSDRFAEAQRRTRWHYQYVVVNDFLPKILGKEAYRAVFRFDNDGLPDFRRRFFRPKSNVYMPVEFSGAAYRYGHSQVRAAYDLNATVTGRPIFLPGDEVGPTDDLRGFRPIPQAWTIEWARFVSIGGSQPQLSRKIDAKLTRGLFDLPGPSGALAFANLKRGQALGLPSGQDVARFLGHQVLTGADLGTSLDPTPLWFYILKESELRAAGHHLGPVGGHIVAEVFAGLLEADRQAYLNVDPRFRPAPPVAPEEGAFGLGELITFALS
jgi:hypothetical protein